MGENKGARENAKGVAILDLARGERAQGHRPGVEQRGWSDVMQPIAAPIIGGMITSTIHVLINIPSMRGLMIEVHWDPVWHLGPIPVNWYGLERRRSSSEPR